MVFEQYAFPGLSTGCKALGIVRPAERLIQMLRTGARHNPRLVPLGTLHEQPVRGSLPLNRAGTSVHFVPEPSLPPIGQVEVVSLGDLDGRRAGILGGSALASATVTVIGCGSLGSGVAVELAKAGVGRFILLDRSRLDVVNVSRHACGLSDVGRFKVDALADLIEGRGGMATPLVGDATADDALLEEGVRKADLVVAATDSPAAQFVTNETCVQQGRRAMFAQAYERAAAGEVFLFAPGRGPCLFCATAFRSGLAEIAPSERRQTYQAADANQLPAEPGLGVDIAYLASVSASYALAVLDPSGSRSDLLAIDRPMVLIHAGSQPRGSHAELFRQPFEHLPARVSRSEPCPVCGWCSEERSEPS